jgi:hypothetical protein
MLRQNQAAEEAGGVVVGQCAGIQFYQQAESCRRPCTSRRSGCGGWVGGWVASQVLSFSEQAV